MRSLTFAAFAGMALVALTACGDAATRLAAPDATNDSRIGTNGIAAESKSGAASRTYTTSGGVTAKTYDGNTSGGGSSSCSALGFGSNGTKVDGAYSQTIAGYRFTVSGNKQSLSFAPVGGAPTSAIVAVIVKGGPGYNVYAYSAGQTTDAGLISPVNGGGNIPGISHYVVCYGPRPVTPTFTKKLVGVMTMGSTPGSMIPDPNWVPGSTTVVIPIGETRWLDYEVSYTLPSGVTGTITEDSHAVCATLGTFVLQCSFNLAPTPTGVYSWSVGSGSGSVIVPIDLGGGGGGSCGDHVFTNTAKLTPSVGSPVTASTDITVRVVCAPPVTLTKTLVRVWKQGATIGSMVPDPAWTSGSSVVLIPIGQTRWLDYEVTYTLPAGVTGTITEDSNAVCSTLGTFILQCSFNLAPTPTGVYSWSVAGGTGTITVPIDLGGGGGGSCGDHVFTNTARLTPSVGSAVSASKDITVRVVCP
jgi:hypothetical protein